MAFDAANRLIRLDMATQLASEIARQIGTGAGNPLRLISLGAPYPLADEIAKQINAGTGQSQRLMALGVAYPLAIEMAEQIGGAGPALSLSLELSGPLTPGSTVTLTASITGATVTDLTSASLSVGGVAVALSGGPGLTRTGTIPAGAATGAVIAAMASATAGGQTISGSATGEVAASSDADWLVANKAEWDNAFSNATPGQIIEVTATIPDRLVVTGDFSGGGLTVRGLPGVELSAGIRLRGAAKSVRFENITISRTQEAEGPFWSPLPVTIYGMVTTDGTSHEDLSFDGVIWDGGLAPFKQGGRMVTHTTASFYKINGLTVRGCTFRRVLNGIDILGCRNVLVEDNDLSGMHGDAFVLQNSGGDCEDIVIRNNHIHDYAGDASNFHMDFVQLQPRGGADADYWIRRVKVYGNTYSFAQPTFVAQADQAGPGYSTEYSESFAVADSQIGQEIRLAPAGGGSMTVTLPSAVASLGKQWTFRQTGNGVINFAFNGSDTWVGGSPTSNAVGNWRTFVSDGSTVWAKLSPGFRPGFMLCTASRDLSELEQGKLLNIDATAGSITLTLPPGATTTYPYVLRRLDATENTVRLVTADEGAMSLGGVPRADITFVQGYAIEMGGVAGIWSGAEDPVTSQLVFGNSHPNGRYADIEVFGNITFGAQGDAVRIEQDVPGLRVYNNTFLRLLVDDQNGDGVIGPFEANSGITAIIDMRGGGAQSWQNFTVGKVQVSSGSVQADNIGGVSLNNPNNVGLQATLGEYFNGSARVDYRPETRAEVIQAALAKAGGPLDGVFIGAAGTNPTNGFYNFDAGQVNTAVLPAPAVVNLDPGLSGKTGPNGVMTLVFDQFVTNGTGQVVLRNRTSGTVIETFDAATGVGSNGGTFEATGRTAKVTPGNPMPVADCAIRIASTAVVGHYGKPFAGYTTDNDWWWSVEDDIPTAFAAVIGSGGYLRQNVAAGFAGEKTKVLIAANVVRAATSDAVATVFIYDAARDFNIYVTASGEVRAGMGSSSWRIPAAVPTSGAPETILMSIDTAAASIADGVKYYRGGSKIPTSAFTSVTWNAGTSITDAGFTTYTGQTVLRGGTGNSFHGTVGFVYFDVPDVLPDLDDPLVRAKFTPQQIGANGSGPTGSAPVTYVTGPATAWNAGANQGTGPDFTVTGSFTNA